MNLNNKMFDKGVKKVSSRDGFGEGLVLAGKDNENVVVLSADLEESTRIDKFIKKFPKRFFEVGVAEQNLVTVASGLAAVGKIPFATSYAVFSPGRNWEQIRTTICYNNVPVKIIGSHTGISVGADGATHQALEDIALMRVLPNMVVISPCDSIEAKKATQALAKINKPCYLRLSRNETPIITTDKTPFKIGKAEVFREGTSATIIATGEMVYYSLLAAKQLEENNISVRVINVHTIKPLDTECVLKAAEETRAIVTVEDHQTVGGLGSAIAEVVSQRYPVPIKMIGINDTFGESGTPEQLMEKYGLTVENIIKAVTTVIRMK
ncbi:MAG: transketolase family protein [Candidatus Daviesbacteria bacterium]|nr:transketolase family protein [Candidatus Daviesbacteria bacterium]